MNYPYRPEEVDAMIEALPHTHFAFDDAPHLSIARYSLSPDYEPRDVDNKRLVDMHGTNDNEYWYKMNQEQKGDLL